MKLSQRGAKRYESFLAAGLELFMQNGYEGTNLSQIVEKSGGSLSSLYKYFKNKEGLFSAIIARRIDDFCQNVEARLNLNENDDLESFLYNFGLIYFDGIYEERTIALCRLVTSECYRKAELGRFFSQQMMTKLDLLLIDFFTKKNIKSQIKQYDPYILAVRFCALVIEPFYKRAVISGSLENLDKSAKEAIVKGAVDIFLNGVKLKQKD